MKNIVTIIALLFVAIALATYILRADPAEVEVVEEEKASQKVPNSTSDDAQAVNKIVIDNVGSSVYEGHTPTTFEGSGTGLFIGDNLHGNFPADAGLQAFVTFDIETLPEEYEDIMLFSSFGRVEGDPLEDLGSIVVDAVSYDAFSSALWDGESLTEVCIFIPQPNGAFRCSVSDLVQDAQKSGASRLSFRLRFETASDGDGERDLLSFRHYDPNANFPGLFQLHVETASQDVREEIRIPITLYRITDSEEFSTRRSQADIREHFGYAADLWADADIVFDVEIADFTLSEEQKSALRAGGLDALDIPAEDKKEGLHGFFIREFDRVNGVAFGGDRFLTVDETTVRGYRTTAHEIGHLMSLLHTEESIGRLMYQGSDGHTLTKEEIERVRIYSSSRVK